MPPKLSPDEVIENLGKMQQAIKDGSDKHDQFSREITSQLKELRREATQQDHKDGLRTSGTDAEARSEYCVENIHETRLATRDTPIAYGKYDGQQVLGREYMAGKSSRVAVRMVSEWDILGNRYPGYVDDPNPRTAHQAMAQEIVAARSLARSIGARSNARGEIVPGATPALDHALHLHMSRGPEWVKFAWADNAGEGAEFIPDVVLPQLERKLELPRAVINLFQTQNVPTGGTTKNPFLTTGCQPFLAVQPALGDLDPAGIVRSVPTTSEITTAPFTWGIVLPANRDAMEDSIVEWNGFGQMLLAEGIRDGMEDAAINMDTNGGDTGLASWNPRSRWNTLGSVRDHRKSGIGLRHRAIDQSATVDLTASQTAAGALAQLTLMSAPEMMDNVVLITSPEWYVKKLLQDPNLLTVDKFGDRATLLTGQLGSIGGKQVVISEFVDKQYNTSGIYDNSTKTKTGALWVARNRWAVAYRRGPRFEVENQPSKQLALFVVTVRWALRNLGSSSDKSEAWLYNCDP